MNMHTNWNAHRSITTALVLVLLFFCIAAAPISAGTPAPPINAFSINLLPDTYSAQEKFFASLKNTGANTLILDLPLTKDGFPDMDVVPNAVFLAHQVGLKLYVVLPTRKIPGLIGQHTDWEDRRYDLGNDSYQLAGKLDLFNPAVVNYLAAQAKELALFSVDAVILGEDFAYDQVEGMSRIAIKYSSIKLDADMDPSRLYRKIGKGPSGHFVQEYSDLFLKWAGLKRDRLVAVFETIRTAARSGNRSVKVGITIPFAYPAPTPVEFLAAYAFDIDAYRRKDVDYFRAEIRYRDMQEQRDLTYRQAVELVARVAKAVFTAAKEGQKTVMVVPMTERLTGKTLRQSETEEITGLIRAVGDTGIGYTIKYDTELNTSFIGKLFKK